MPANFKEEEKKQIRENLLKTGLSMCYEMSLKGMTVEKLAKKCNIAKGTFYHFYPSKEAFIADLFAENEKNTRTSLKQMLHGREKAPLKELLRWYRGCFTFRTNFAMNFRARDFIWLKEHMNAFDFFHPDQDSRKGEELLALAEDIRADFDPGVVVNFVKTIYCIAANRDTFCAWAIDTNIDLIFKSIYMYLKPEKEEL